MPVTATKIASAVRKTAIPVTRTSVCSYPNEVSTSSGFGPCEPSCSSSCVGMFGLQDLRQVRVVDLNQGTGFQLHREIHKPETDQRPRYRDVLKDSPAEMQVSRSILEVRLDQPKQVERL